MTALPSSQAGKPKKLKQKAGAASENKGVEHGTGGRPSEGEVSRVSLTRALS
jgi:hypothetical protein